MINQRPPFTGIVSTAVLAATVASAAAQSLPPTPPVSDAILDRSAARSEPAFNLDELLRDGPFEAKSDPLQPLKGARSVAEAEKGPEAKRQPEWFGGPTPWRSWTRMTGDWAGGRTALEDNGLTFGASYTFDGATVLDGGLRRRSVARGLLDLNVTFDPEPLLGLKGGTFFAQYYFRHGRFGGSDVGDVLGYSNLDADRLSRAEEVWYEQKLLGDLLRIKLGQVDANAEFAFLEAAGDFIQASAGFSPTLLGLPTYPDPALSVNVFLYPVENVYVGAGAYTDNFKHLDSKSFETPFFIGEAGITHGGGKVLGPGRVAAGAWFNTEDVDRFDGGVESGTAGFYLVGEQQVWRENPEAKDDAQGVSLLAQYGWADGNVSPFVHHVGLGVASTGLMPGRDDDAVGLRWNWAELSREAGAGFSANESNLEFFYKIQVTPFCSIKPGLQWIHHPGGTAAADDAVVGTLRATFDF